MIGEAKLRPPRGTRDLTPEEYYRYAWMERVLSDTAELYGYLRVETPAFEHFEVLAAKAGPSVVEEIYYFRDKAGRELGLRFDMTVPIARVLAYRLDVPRPVRWYYFTKVWRYDEPQHGRYREFYQFGVELVGSGTPRADAEILSLFVDCLDRVGVEGYVVKVNDRRYVERLIDAYGLSGRRDDVLRTLDKRGKVPDDDLVESIAGMGIARAAARDMVDRVSREVSIREAPHMMREVGLGELADRYEALAAVGRIGERAVFAPYIVRGLDYYTGLVFESYVPRYGLAIGGGGRYDDLLEIYSGVSTPALGFAIGVERTLEVLALQGRLDVGPPRVDYYIYVFRGEHYSAGEGLASGLRRRGYRVVLDLGDRSLRSALDYANRIGARRFVFLGPREYERGVVKVRDMDAGTEEEVPLGGLA